MPKKGTNFLKYTLLQLFRAISADIKFLKSWAESTKAELDKMDKSDPHYKGKSDLYASLLAKATSAVGSATVTGAPSFNGNLTRDQIAALRSAETALSSLEFTGRDFDLNAPVIATTDKIRDNYNEDDVALASNFIKQVSSTDFSSICC